MAATASGILAAALSQIGVKYTWGGEAPGKDFDCSGLTQWAYSTVGVDLPRTSQAQALVTTRVPAAQAMPGMLVFSAGSDGTQSSPGHVGIYLGDGKYIDAPHTGAFVQVTNVPADAWYGAVPGVVSDAGPDGSAIGGGLQQTSTGVGCGSKGKVFGIATVSVSYCQAKAVTGGLLVGAGGGVALLGVLIVVAWGLGHTSAGRGVAAAARVVPRL